MRRLAEVEAWLEQSRSGRAMPPIYPRPLFRIGALRGSWTSRDAETYRQLPADVRADYALFYDIDDALQDAARQNVLDWRQLYQFAEPGPVSREERRRAWPLLDGLRLRTDLSRGHIEAERAIAGRLGIRPILPATIDRNDYAEGFRCRSIHVRPKT